MGRWPDFWIRRGSKEWSDHFLRQPVPHELEEPYGCSCASCEEWRAARVIPGALVVGFLPDHRKGGSGGGATSWSYGEQFNWGPRIDKPSLVVGDLPEWASGAHLDCVVVLHPDMGLRVTSRKWLVVLTGGRAVVQPSQATA